MFAKAIIGLPLLFALALTGYFAFDQISGQRLVRGLCNTDGGLRSYGRARARGVLAGDQIRGPRCTECAEWLADGTYDYMDVRISPSSALGYGISSDGEYYRYTIAPVDDAKCILRSTSLNTQIRYTEREDEARAGITPARCLVLEALPGRPSGYVYDVEYGKPIANSSGRTIRADVTTISDSQSGAVVATYRNYMFFSKWSYLFALGTGSPNASVSCADPNQVGRDLKWFNKNALSKDVPAVHIR